MPEELALEQGLGDGRAVHGNERSIGALAVRVDGPGDELLAGAALARDENDGVGRRDLHDAPEHVADGLGPADDVLEMVLFLELLGEKLDLSVELS